MIKLKPNVFSAINSLLPNIKFNMINGDDWEHVEWTDKSIAKPTESEVNIKLVELQASYDAQEYARNRATEYPALSEQLDEIYHNGIASWKAVIKVTKDKYPKG